MLFDGLFDDLGVHFTSRYGSLQARNLKSSASFTNSLFFGASETKTKLPSSSGLTCVTAVFLDKWTHFGKIHTAHFQSNYHMY